MTEYYYGINTLMKGGTTQPTLSADLWAQVAALKPGIAR